MTVDYRRMPYCWIRYWRSWLGLDDLAWYLGEVDENMVTAEDGTTGHEIVGVICGGSPHATEFTIIHSRPLTEDDVIHELLHVKYPSWGEQTVEEETWRLYLIRKDERRRA